LYRDCDTIHGLIQGQDSPVSDAKAQLIRCYLISGDCLLSNQYLSRIAWRCFQYFKQYSAILSDKILDVFQNFILGFQKEIPMQYTTVGRWRLACEL